MCVCAIEICIFSYTKKREENKIKLTFTNRSSVRVFPCVPSSSCVAAQLDELFPLSLIPFRRHYCWFFAEPRHISSSHSKPKRCNESPPGRSTDGVVQGGGIVPLVVCIATLPWSTFCVKQFLSLVSFSSLVAAADGVLLSHTDAATLNWYAARRSSIPCLLLPFYPRTNPTGLLITQQ